MNSQQKELSYKLTVRVYGLKFDPSLSHSFLIDDQYTGISPPIGQLNIDIRKMRLCDLRPIIEFDRSGHMNKRSVMFAEALFIMSRLPNYFKRPPQELNKYQFGFLHKETSDLRLIAPDNEHCAISELIGAVDYFSYDLALVPLSQINPSG